MCIQLQNKYVGIQHPLPKISSIGMYLATGMPQGTPEYIVWFSFQCQTYTTFGIKEDIHVGT